jgi:hypothetical protein
MIIRRRLTGFVLTGLTAALLAGCSGSSSGGTAPSASPRTENTAKALGSESFKNVSKKADHSLGIPLPSMRGVASEIYYPTTKTLTVTYKSTADKTDQQNVENIVRQHEQQAALKPTKTSKASS